MILPLNKRRLLLGTGGCALGALVLLFVARRTLTGWALGALLQLGGASQVSFNVTEATPWHVVVDDLSFQVRTQAFAARRVTIDRRHWWMPSLGVVRVEQARVPLTIDGSDTNPWSWSTYQNGRAKVQPWQVPLEKLVADGQLVLMAAALPARELNVKLEAQLTAQSTWEARGQADGPGLSLQGEGRYDVTRDELTFKVPVIALDLKAWENFVRRLVLLPGGAWELEGNLTGRAEGRLAGKQLTGTGTLRLQAGQARNREHAVTAAGIEADLEFTDLAQLITRPGAVRIRELQTGRLLLRDIEAEVALGGSNKIAVGRVAFQTLGGTAILEPFNYFPALREVEVVAVVDGLGMGELMAVTRDLPASATGRLNGRLPFRMDDGGVRLGAGWLQLRPDAAASLQFLHGDRSRIRLTGLRLDIRPPGAPPGCSAQLQIAGEPSEQGGNAPFRLDLNVAGPLERFLDLDLDARPR